MKTRRIIAALCALTMTLAAADGASCAFDSGGLPRLLTAVAEGEGQEQNQGEPNQEEQNQEEQNQEAEKTDLAEAEVSVNAETQTVTVQMPDDESEEGFVVVPAEEYTLTYYTDTGILLGDEFPTDPGSYYVVVTAKDDSESYTGVSGADGDNVFDVPNPYWKTDTLTAGNVTGTGYNIWDFESEESGAKYTANTSKNAVAILLRSNSNSGIVTTTTGGRAVQVNVSWTNSTHNKNKVLNIYGKNEPYDSPADLYDSNKQGDLIATIAYQDFSTKALYGYQYIGIRSNSGILYLNDVNITWNDMEDPEIEKINLDTADVTVDKESKTVTVTMPDGEVVPEEDYTVKFYNEEDMEPVEEAFPTKPGGYIAIVRAKADDTETGFVNPYKGTNDKGYLYIDPWYTVTIPAAVTLGGTATVSASDVELAKNTTLSVRLTAGSPEGFQVAMDDQTDPLSYTVSKDGEEITSGTNVLTIPYGTNEGSAELQFNEPIDPIFVGNYTGTVNFTVSIN